MISLKKWLPVLYFVLLLLFLFACYGGSVKWWPVELLVMSTFYVFIAVLIIAVIYFSAKKFRSAIMGLAVILICLPALKHIWQPLGSSIPFGKKQENNIRILNWNVNTLDVVANTRNSFLRDSTLAIIKKYKPDIACFEEFVGAQNDTTQINYVPDLVAKMGMGSYYYVFDDDEHYFKNQDFGKVIISRYPIVKAVIVTSGPKSYNYRFIFADTKINDDTVRVFVLHLQSLKIQDKELSDKMKSIFEIVTKIKLGYEKRAIQSKVIRKYIEQSPYPVIICGDFNTVPNSFAYKKIGEGLQNAFVKKGTGLGTTFPGLLPTLRIDNIFLSENFEVKGFYTPRIKLSDHYPVMADVELKK